MDRVLFLDFANYAWLANITFKPKAPKPKPTAEPINIDASSEWIDEGPGPAPKASFEPPASTEEKPVPPENVLIFNFFRNLRSLIEPFAPHKIVAVLEGHPAFRHELYPEYKANRLIKTAEANPARTEAKERFDKAVPEILRLLRFMPITQMRHKDYEADDVIGALVEDSKDNDVIVVSNDSDYIQLLQKGYTNFRLYSPSKKTMIQAPSWHYLTWKCMRGDKSDNIRSLMGDKTAQKMCLDPEKLRAWLEVEENRANFSINKQLIEFAAVNLNELEIEEGVGDWDRLKLEFEQLDFKSMLTDTYWPRFQRTFETVRY